MPAEIVVSGLGLVTPAGHTQEENWAALCRARSLAGRDPELAGLPVESINDAGLAGNAGYHFAALAGLEPWIDPGHLRRIRVHRRVNQQSLERMIEIPVIDHVLVIPGHFAGVEMQRQCRVVVEIRLIIAGQPELGCRRGNRCPDVDQLQLGIETGHHPSADVAAVLIGNVAPGLVAGLAGPRDGAGAPQLLAGLAVVGGDDAAVGRRLEFAAAAGNDFAVGDDRPGGLLR